MLLFIRGFAMSPALARSDVAVFASWITGLAQYGTGGFYAAVPGVDYVPGYLLVLRFLGWCYGPLAAHDPQGRILQSLVRLPAILADIALIAAALALAKRMGWKNTGPKILAFSPALLLLTSYWGQVDAIGAALLTVAILATIGDNIALCWIVFAIAVVTKPQPVVIGPLLLAYQLFRGKWTALLWAPAATALTCYAVSLPFTTLRAPFAVWSWFLERYVSGIGKYPFASTNAFNLFGVFGRIYTPDAELLFGIPLRTWGIGMFAVLSGAVLIRLILDLRRNLDFQDRSWRLLLACVVVLFGLFILTTRMHERYMFVALALMTAAIRPGDRNWLRAVIAAHTIFFINCLFTLTGFHDRFTGAAVTYAAGAFSLVNCYLFSFCARRFFAPAAATQILQTPLATEQRT